MKLFVGACIALFVCVPLITSAQEETTEVASEEATPTPVEPIVITSEQFPREDAWYSARMGIFNWNLPKGTLAIAVDIATTSGAEPLTVYNPPISALAVGPESLTEGIQFLNVQIKGADGVWGAVTAYRIAIDITPPAPFTVTTSFENGQVRASFPATDTLSGIDHYEVALIGGDPMTVSPEDAGRGFLTDEVEEGRSMVVTAYDRAGNTAVASAPLTGTLRSEMTSEGSGTGLWFIENINPGAFTLNLLAIFGILIPMVFLLYVATEMEHTRKRERALRREMADVEREMQKVFTALRYEIYEQINAIAKKKGRMTAGEKRAVAGLESALRVSETMIEKEITDVKKIVK